jgi:hypothetical protein
VSNSLPLQPRADGSEREGRAEMANHGKQTRTGAKRERHYAKPSRAKRHERRWDARVEEMRVDMAEREVAAKAAAEAASAEAA